MGQTAGNRRKIKKYANRKMYDTVRKRYISLDQLSELIQEGEEVVVEDNETGEDITGSVVSQILARGSKSDAEGVPSNILMGLLRKGTGTVAGYAKRSTEMLQGAVTLAEDEIDKLVGLLVKNEEISESEGSRLRSEMMGRADHFRKWVGEKVDQRVNEALSMMNLATKDQVARLNEKIDALSETVARLENAKAAPGKGAEIKSYGAEGATEVTKRTSGA
jgi:polyhydroxyalkanoate synthesis repressor PhaR